MRAGTKPTCASCIPSPPSTLVVVHPVWRTIATTALMRKKPIGFVLIVFDTTAAVPSNLQVKLNLIRCFDITKFAVAGEGIHP